MVPVRLHLQQDLDVLEAEPERLDVVPDEGRRVFQPGVDQDVPLVRRDEKDRKPVGPDGVEIPDHPVAGKGARPLLVLRRKRHGDEEDEADGGGETTQVNAHAKHCSHVAPHRALRHCRRLETFGPSLGRPTVDTLNGSRHTNMKELRFTAPGGVWRVAFAFDPKRKAILFVAGATGPRVDTHTHGTTDHANVHPPATTASGPRRRPRSPPSFRDVQVWLTGVLPPIVPATHDKSLGMRDYPGQSGTIRDKTPVFAVVFGRRRGQMGIKTFVPRFSPLRRFSRGLGTVLTPGKACLKGLAAITTNTTQATIQAQIKPSSSWWRGSEPSRSAAARSARYSRTFRRHAAQGVRTAGGRSASASRSDGERTRGPRGVRRGARGGAHERQPRDACPGRLPRESPAPGTGG